MKAIDQWVNSKTYVYMYRKELIIEGYSINVRIDGEKIVIIIPVILLYW